MDFDVTRIDERGGTSLERNPNVAMCGTGAAFVLTLYSFYLPVYFFGVGNLHGRYVVLDSSQPESRELQLCPTNWDGRTSVSGFKVPRAPRNRDQWQPGKYWVRVRLVNECRTDCGGFSVIPHALFRRPHSRRVEDEIVVTIGTDRNDDSGVPPTLPLGYRDWQYGPFDSAHSFHFLHSAVHRFLLNPI